MTEGLDPEIDESAGDESEWSLARREFLADERDRLADARDVLADRRDAEANEREQEADEREADFVGGRLPAGSRLSSETRSAAAARVAAREARHLAAQLRDDARDRRAEQRAHRASTSPTILARLFADIAGQLFQPGPLESVLTRVATVATDLVPGCAYASVTVVSDRGPVTPVATDAVARESDALQYEAGQGPSLDATQERIVYTPEIGGDPRWPGLQSLDFSVRAVASFGLHEAWQAADDRAGPRAALNLYGTTIDAIPEDGRELGMLLAAHASVAMLVAAERDRARQRDDDFHAALLSRDVIGQAKGILMEREKVTADEAFDILRRTSQAYNRKLHDIAERLALTGELPPPSG